MRVRGTTLFYSQDFVSRALDSPCRAVLPRAAQGQHPYQDRRGHPRRHPRRRCSHAHPDRDVRRVEVRAHPLRHRVRFTNVTSAHAQLALPKTQLCFTDIFPAHACAQLARRLRRIVFPAYRSLRSSPTPPLPHCAIALDPACRSCAGADAARPRSATLWPSPLSSPWRRGVGAPR